MWVNLARGVLKLTVGGNSSNFKEGQIMCNHLYRLKINPLETYWECELCGNRIYLKEPS